MCSRRYVLTMFFVSDGSRAGARGFISAFKLIVERLRDGDGLGNVRFLREYADCTRRRIEAERCACRQGEEGHRFSICHYFGAAGERLLRVPSGGHGTTNRGRLFDPSEIDWSTRPRSCFSFILSINTHKTVEVAVWLNEKGIVLMGVLYLVFGFILTRVRH